MAATLDAFGKRPVAVAGGNLYAALRADLITSCRRGLSSDCIRVCALYGMVFLRIRQPVRLLNTVDDWDGLHCLGTA